MNWPTLIVLVIGLLIGAAWGSSRSHRDAVRWIEHFVSADAGQRSAIRDLYLAEGYEAPDFYAEAEPEPKPRWWTRAWAAVGRQEWASVAVVPPDRHDLDEMADTKKPSDGPAADLSDGAGALGSSADDTTFTPDPSPATQPIVMPEPTGPTTQPDMKAAAKVAPLPTFEEWQREFTARVERDLAEIRGTK